MRVDDAAPAMRLARPALSPDGRILLGQGAALTAGYLERLRALGVWHVWIHDDRVADVAEMEFFTTVTHRCVSDRVTEVLRSLPTDRMAARAVMAGGALGALVDEAMDNRRELVPAPEAGVLGNPLVAHSVRVCLLVTAIGAVWQFERESAANLAAGALLHDIGHVLSHTSEGGGAPDALDLISPDHTSLGFEAVVNARRLSATVAIACLQHHERVDGSGYPKGLAADKIHPFAGLVAVADRYDNLVCGKSPMLPHQAMEQLQREAPVLLDAGLVAKFRARVAPYPTGTPLVLNTGQQGVVVGVSAGHLDRPTVRILGPEAAPFDVDLATEPSLAIRAVAWTGSVVDSGARSPA